MDAAECKSARPTYPMTFPELLKSERERLGISQKRAAAILGVADRTYWDWEAGKAEPVKILQEGAESRLKKIKTPPRREF